MWKQSKSLKILKTWATHYISTHPFPLSKKWVDRQLLTERRQVQTCKPLEVKTEGPKTICFSPHKKLKLQQGHNFKVTMNHIRLLARGMHGNEAPNPAANVFSLGLYLSVSGTASLALRKQTEGEDLVSCYKLLAFILVTSACWKKTLSASN